MGYLEEKKRISGEIPEPTFGYLRGISAAYRKKGDELRNNLAEWDLGDLLYVGEFGQCDSEDTFVRREDGCVCRYHMRCARGLKPFGDRRSKLPTLAIDRVSIQKDILDGQLWIVDIADGDRE